MLPVIQSAHNPQLKHLAKLLSAAKHRRACRQTVLEGVHLLAAYLDGGNLPQRVYIPRARTAQPEYAALLCRLPESVCTAVEDGLLGKISSLNDADDIAALIDLPAPPPLPQQGDCVVLNRVQDAGNVGTVLRSAAAAGIRTVLLDSGCADAYSPKVLRAGMGAHFLLDIIPHADLYTWAESCRSRKLATALGSGNPQPLYDLDLREPSAWLFGNEGSGIDPRLLQCADAAVRIPMAGATESLNIAMAATVCLFEQMRQRIQAA